MNTPMLTASLFARQNTEELFTNTDVPISTFITNQKLSYISFQRSEHSQCWMCASLIALGGLVGLWERYADVSTSSHQGQDSSVGNYIPGQCQGDVLIGPDDGK